MRLLAMCLFAFCSAAAAHLDLEPYPDGTLAQALAEKPGPAFELLAADQRLRIATLWSGHARNASPEVVPLLRAWNDRRRRGEAGPVLSPRGKLVELELREDGKSYWVLLDQDMVRKRALVDQTYGLPGVVLLHHIGYAQGRAVAAIVGLSFRQYADRAGYYTRGEARFIYKGKPYRLPVSIQPGPAGEPLSSFKRRNDGNGVPFEAIDLTFGEVPQRMLVVSMHLRGAGDYPTHEQRGINTVPMAQFRSARDESASLDVNLLIGSDTFVHPMPEEYLGCTLKMARVDLDGVRGKLDCPGPLASGISGIEFEATD